MSPCVLRFLICVSCLGVSHVHSNDDEVDKVCDDPPVFSPSHLVVRHGGSASATCTVCQEKCHGKHFGVERALGTVSENGTTITWTVDKMTEWDSPPLCYYGNWPDQCSTALSITVYQPPVRVSLSFVNHSGPMILGHTYTMQCLVEDVAPVEGLSVAFYRGETKLAQFKLEGQQKKPVTKAMSIVYHPVREDQNWNYYCEAILQLGTERFSWRSSEGLNVETHFPPQLDVPPHSDSVTVTEGDALSLNCSAYGRPDTSYGWVLPSGQIITGGSMFTRQSVSVSDEGHYICFAGNYLGNVTVDYSVFVQRVMTTTTATTTQMVLDTTRSTGNTGTTRSTGNTGTTRSTGNTGTTRSTGNTGIIFTTRSTRSTGSTSRTTVHRFTLGFMLLFLALV